MRPVKHAPAGEESLTLDSCQAIPFTARMATDHFDVVTIETNRHGVHLNVTNTLQVAELLVEEWPAERGLAYRKAVKACMDHMAGKASAAAVRKAFIAAAKEADIFVREGPLFQ